MIGTISEMPQRSANYLGRDTETMEVSMQSNPITLCAVEGCASPRAGRSRYCSAHAHRFQRYGDPLVTRHSPRGLTAEQRFWRYVDKDGPIPDYAPQLGNCWIWQGSKGTYGHGRFNFTPTRQMPAHRFAYQQLVGPIPDGLELDHLCRVPSCVRTTHVEPVTGKVNKLRGISPSAIHATKTHCPQGHPYDEANTRIDKDNRRHCRVCEKARRR